MVSKGRGGDENLPGTVISLECSSPGLVPADEVVGGFRGGEGRKFFAKQPGSANVGEARRYRHRHAGFGGVQQIWANVGTYRRVRQLLHLPAYIDTVQNNPKFGFKYLAPRYLALDLTIAERAACFLHNYQRLHSLLPDRVLRQILHWDVQLHEIREGGNCFTLCLGRSRPFYKEGELSLHLKVDGEIFFTLAFTIVPGWVVESGVEEVLLISRLQGTPGCYPDQMKLATKAMHGVRPRTALLCGLEGIATACGIREVAGVSALRQSSYSAGCEEFLVRSYDDFFADLGVPKNSAGFFLIPIPTEEIPLEQISAGNRSRAKKNRALKQEIREDCGVFFGKLRAEPQRARRP